MIFDKAFIVATSQQYDDAHFYLDIGDTPLGNELVWRKGMTNSDSYFTITNLLSSKILTAVSFNITIGKEADNPNIIGLEIHGKILYSFFFTKKPAALSFYSFKLLWTGSKYFRYVSKSIYK